MLNRFRAWRLRKRMRKAVYSIDGIERIDQSYLHNIILEIAKRYSESLYKDIEISAKKKMAYKVRKGRKGYFFPYLVLEINAKKGCCSQESFVLKNPKMHWQIVISVTDKYNNIRISEPKNALIFLGLAKPI